MSDNARTITIKFTANTKGLITEAALVDTALDKLGKKSSSLDKLSKSFEGLGKVGTKLVTTGRNLAIVETAITTLAKVGAYLKPMLGLLGLVPGAVAIAAGAFAVLKLGSAGIAAAFKGVADSAKTQVSGVFQKDLAPAAKNVKTLLDKLIPSLKGVAAEMSGVFVAVTKTATSADNVKSLNTILGATKTVVGNIGKAFAPLLSTFLTVASVAAPIFAGLTNSAGAWADRLNAKVNEVARNGQLAAWIQGGINRFIDFKNKIVAFVEQVKPIISNLASIRLQLFGEISPLIIPVLTALTGFLAKNPNLALWIIGVGLAFKALGAAVTGFSAVLKVFEADPIVLIVIGIAAAIAALVAGFVYLWNTSAGFRAFWEGLWNAVQTAATAVVAWFQSTALPFLTQVWGVIVSAAQAAWGWFSTNLLPIFQQAWQGIQEAVQGFLSWADANIVPWFQQVWGQIKDAASAFGDFWNSLWGGDFGQIASAALQGFLVVLTISLGAAKDIFGGVFNAIIDVLKGAWDIISGVISGAFQIIKGIFEVFTGLLTGNWSKFWGGLGDILGGAWSIIRGIGEGIGNVLKGVGDIAVGVGKAIAGAFSGLGGILKSALNGVISIANTAIHGINAVTGIVGIPNIPDIPHLAKGGPVQAGRAYIVGDGGGPELFVPGQSGRVVGTQDTADLMGGGDDGAPIVIHLDLGEGITKRFEIHDRKLRARAKAGATR